MSLIISMRATLLKKKVEDEEYKQEESKGRKVKVEPKKQIQGLV